MPIYGQLSNIKDYYYYYNMHIKQLRQTQDFSSIREKNTRYIKSISKTNEVLMSALINEICKIFVIIIYEARIPH